MRSINFIIVHCSATRCDHSYTEHDLTTDHLRRGFSDTGYHLYIRKNGDIKTLRPIGQPGAYTEDHNAHSVGICYKGGFDEREHPADTRTNFQKHSLRVLVMLLLRGYPDSCLRRYYDLNPGFDCSGEIGPEEWIEVCPCFDAASIPQDSVPPNPAYP